jgi:hypothetical protein
VFCLGCGSFSWLLAIGLDFLLLLLLLLLLWCAFSKKYNGTQTSLGLSQKDRKTVILQTSASTKLNERINYYFFFVLSFSKVNAIIDNVVKTGLKCLARWEFLARDVIWVSLCNCGRPKQWHSDVMCVQTAVIPALTSARTEEKWVRQGISFLLCTETEGGIAHTHTHTRVCVFVCKLRTWNCAIKKEE